MQRTSDSIGVLAGALAKAQSELVNPEKTVAATIASPFPREGSRTFRYASLSSGLEIIRKCLGKYEIATVQATAIEKETGLICLTTTLVHSSGEWISSDWPVAPSSDTTAPHRLGAALTYARRYALFTLVGIAGEDDLDAPDLNLTPEPSTGQNSFATSGSKAEELRGAPLKPPRNSQHHARTQQPRPILLPQKASQDIRDQLISELVALNDSNLLADWAQRALPLKNQLLPQDAERLETTFSAHLGQLDGDAKGGRAQAHDDNPHEPTSPTSVVVSIRKPVRERDRQHLRFVASQPCLICGRTPSDAHHVKFAQLPTIGRKVSDKYTVPICRLHHRELHRLGNEPSWWQAQGIDPLPVAATLWRSTHDSPLLSEESVDNNRSAALDVPATAIQRRNDKTNPIVPPEAK
jgi:hypothetical protein